MFLKISQNSYENILWHRCFPLNFAKFLKTTFLIENLRWLLLIILTGYKISLCIMASNKTPRQWLRQWNSILNSVTYVYTNVPFLTPRKHQKIKDFRTYRHGKLTFNVHNNDMWCPVKKLFLNMLQNSQENTCARVSFLKLVSAIFIIF